MFKKALSSIVAATLFSTGYSANAFEISDSFNGQLILSALSDYRSHGISQSKGDPALQGELIVFHESGLLGGLWLSSVDFGADTKTRMEQGAYFGIYKEPLDDLKVTATIGRYIYPKESSFTLNEFYGSVEYKRLKYAIVYDYGMDAPNAKFQYISYTIPLPLDTDLYLEYGFHDVGNTLFSSDGKVSDNYNTYKASLKKNIIGIDWSLSYIDTTVSDFECLNATGFKESCQAGVIIGASKSF